MKSREIPNQKANAHSEVAKASTPLTPKQGGIYAAAMADTEAVFALEDMMPSSQDKAITDAIVAGRVSPERARKELLAYVLEHKTVRGFVESRPWSIQ